MIHEFIMSIVEDRKPLIDDIKGAYWTATGICAHLSAMEGGKKMRDFRISQNWIENKVMQMKNGNPCKSNIVEKLQR